MHVVNQKKKTPQKKCTYMHFLLDFLIHVCVLCFPSDPGTPKARAGSAEGGSVRPGHPTISSYPRPRHLDAAPALEALETGPRGEEVTHPLEVTMQAGPVGRSLWPSRPGEERGKGERTKGMNQKIAEETLETQYASFLEKKSQLGSMGGFEPLFMPGFLFDFQKALVEWAVRRGRAAIFADCGLGKTPMQLVWAQNVVEKTNGRVLILTPLAVGQQTVGEGQKFGIECHRSRDGHLNNARITVTNYEQLHRFDWKDFAGVVCDESSILKHFSGATQKAVTRFMLKLPYRLLCTATAAPNDYIELGTSSEALGELGHSDMLSRFFRQDDNKGYRMNEVKLARERHSGHYARLAYRISQQIGQWKLKGHAEVPFWRWVASWARACRSPKDLGFDDARFVLPPLIEQSHIIMPKRPLPGMLFTLPAVGLNDEREERKRTLEERCELAAATVGHDRPAVVWCHFNAEGTLLSKLIPDGMEVKGGDSDDAKEEAYRAFSSGQLRVLITKPKIGAWGLNWQHCSDVVSFVSHSYEQYYQSVRRCWRFGQTHPVTVDLIATKGEERVSENMARKAAAAAIMFDRLVYHMSDALKLSRTENSTPVEVPSWLKNN
jgi:hypothetical protein